MTVVYYKSWVLAILLSHKLIQNSGISESSRNLQKVNCNIFCYMIAPFIRFFLLLIRDLLSYVYFLPANSLDKCLTFLFMIWLSQLTQQFLIIVHDTFNAMETLERVITRILKKSMIFLDLIFFSRWLQSQAGFRHCTEQWILFFLLKIIIEVGTRISSYLINGFSQVEFQYTVLGKNSSWFMRDKWSWPIVQLYNNFLERKSSVI